MARGYYGRIGQWDTGSTGIRFKQFGQWEQTLRLLQGLSREIKEASVAAQFDVCNEICTRVKNHLDKQDLPWRALSSRYSAQKERAQADDRILIATGSYFNAIKVWRSGNAHFVFVGVRKGIYGKTLSGQRSRLEISQIAAFHEFSGNAKIRRPLWNPTIQELGGMKGIKSLYLKSLVKHLRRQGVPVKYKSGSFEVNVQGSIFKL